MTAVPTVSLARKPVSSPGHDFPGVVRVSTIAAGAPSSAWDCGTITLGFGAELRTPRSTPVLAVRPISASAAPPQDPPHAPSFALTGGDHMVGLVPGNYELAAQDGTRQTLRLVPGESIDVTWPAAARRVDLRLRDANGSPLPGWRLVDGEGATHTTDASGAVWLASLPERLNALLPAGTTADTAGLEHREPTIAVLLQPTAHDGLCEWRLTPAQWPGATVTLPLSDPHWRGEVLLLDALGGPRLRRVVERDTAAVTFAPVPPGHWQFALGGRGHVWQFVPRVQVRAGDSITLAPFAAQPTATLRVRWPSTATAIELGVRCAGQLLPLEATLWRRGDPLRLAAGEYEVLLTYDGAAPLSRTITLAPGEAQELALVAPAATRHTMLWIEGATTADEPSVPVSLILRQAGVLRWHSRRRLTAASAIPWPLALDGGDYEVEVLCSRGTARGHVTAGCAAVRLQVAP